MMDDKKTNIESTEVKGYRELDSYESYKMNGNQGTRHLVEANSFKIKIMAMLLVSILGMMCIVQCLTLFQEDLQEYKESVLLVVVVTDFISMSRAKRQRLN